MSSNHAHWRSTVEYADYDQARADAVEQALERLRQPKPERSVVWRLPAPGAAKEPELPTGLYRVVSQGRVLFERETLREAARVALSLKGAVVRQGSREWGREELKGLGK